MTERPILRLPNSREANRRRGGRRSIARPRGPGRARQIQRFQPSFDQLTATIQRLREGIALRDDPAGISPDRALVFETAGSIQNFARAARRVGLEILFEEDLDDLTEIPEGFEPPGEGDTLPRTLYTTMPTVESSERLLALWRAHRRGEAAPDGAAPWWQLFDLLIDLRTWGPADRFSDQARQLLDERLPEDDDETLNLELEIWGSSNRATRDLWRNEAIAKVQNLGGDVIDRANIDQRDFIYDALLVRLPAGAVRQLIDDPNAPDSLAWIRGIHFILPQTIAQALPDEPEVDNGHEGVLDPFDEGAPARAVLLDGVALAAHPALDGGIAIEDVHDIVPRSLVQDRSHATSMASLILRGDLEQDGAPLADAQLLNVPILIDEHSGRASSPNNRLFVDVVHTALAELFTGPDALAPDSFVVNFSIGIQEMRFAGRTSALARLLDWWSHEYGVLFVVSSGNIPNPVIVQGVAAGAFEDAEPEQQREMVRDALAEAAFERTLMAPAESINSLTVGAASHDRMPVDPPARAGTIRLDHPDEPRPALTSAIGLGLQRSLKPDLLQSGGIHEVRILADGESTRLRVANPSRFAGLVVAAPTFAAGASTKRSIGTSCAAALTTRDILLAAHELVIEEGPYAGQELRREDLALLTRALAVNAARWPGAADAHYRSALQRFGRYRSSRAKEEVARYYGYGLLLSERMCESPENGATLIGLGTLRKDGARIFDLPLPPSLAGERIPRSMHVTLAWFSPVSVTRAQYRLAGLEAIASDTDEEGNLDQEQDTTWGLALKTDGPDQAMVKRGSVWSRRLKHDRLTVPDFDEGATIPIRVQCRDTSGGGLNPDIDIRFAIAVTLLAEAAIQFDIYQEIQDQIRLRLQGNA